MFYKKENSWKSVNDALKKEIFAFSEKYKKFLSENKTEREVVSKSLEMAIKKGFVDADNLTELNPGDKIYYLNREKNLVLAVIGKEPILNGVNFVVSHVDSPRLDLKQNPLYEDEEYALFKTHYYGGVKKYQWASRALALHGVVVLKDGKKINIVIGEKEDDPVLPFPIYYLI